MPKKFIHSLSERSTVKGYSSEESDCEQLDEEGDNHEIHLERRSRPKEKRSVRYPRPHSHLFRNRFGGRTRGGRHARRQDNSLYLSTLHQIDEEDLEEDYNSVAPEHNTPFRTVLTSQKHLQLWQSFDSLSEEDQAKVLSKRSTSRQGIGRKTMRGKKLDCLDPHLRTILSQTKRIPKDFVRSLEEDFREYFSDHEMGVMVLVQLTSFQRMLVHGICQYTGLTSQRFEVNGEPYLAVSVDTLKSFNPPVELLYTLLK